MRPSADENSQIGTSTTVRAARGAGRSTPRLSLAGRRKKANIHASSGAIWGIQAKLWPLEPIFAEKHTEEVCT